MKRFLVILGVIAALGFIVPVTYQFYRHQTAFGRGKTQALEDLAMGRVTYKLNGLPNANAQRLFQLLKDKGVAYSAMDAGESQVLTERSGYNNVMIPVILERYAIDVPAVLRGEQGPEK